MSRCLFTRAGRLRGGRPRRRRAALPRRAVRPVRPVVHPPPPPPPPVLPVLPASPPRATGPTLTFPVSGRRVPRCLLRRALGCPPPPWGASPQSPRAPPAAPRADVPRAHSAYSREVPSSSSSPPVAARITATPPSRMSGRRPSTEHRVGERRERRDAVPATAARAGTAGGPRGAPRGCVTAGSSAGAAEGPAASDAARRRARPPSAGAVHEPPPCPRAQRLHDVAVLLHQRSGTSRSPDGGSG